VPVAGGTPNLLYPAFNAMGLTVVGALLFWIDPNAGPVSDTEILAAPTSGAGPITAIYVGSAVGQPIFDGSGLTTDGTSLYAADESGGNVFVLNTNGAGVTRLNTAARWGGEQQNAITWSGGTLFDTSMGDSGSSFPAQVVSLPATGGSFTTLWSGAPLAATHGGIAVGNGAVYVTDTGNNTIWSVPATGGNPTVLVSGAPFVYPAAALFFDDNLYVLDGGTSGTTGALYRISLQGGGGGS
jgi:DNA-binding beta-propeller fold protein YncE